MNFSMAEIDTLRLVGRYKSLPQELEQFHTRMLSPAGIQSLCHLSLLRIDKRGCLCLTPSGWDFLAHIGYGYPRDKNYVTDPQKLLRRKEAAVTMFTFYRAGIDVFADNTDALCATPLYLSSAAARRNFDLGVSKIWAGSRMAGIARMGDTAYAVYHTDAAGIQFVGEMDLFHKLTARHCERTACIYADGSYRDAASWLTPNQLDPPRRGGWVSFHGACERTDLPIHLLETTNTGALQLVVMNTPNYRERIARSALRGCYLPPRTDLPETDGIMNGRPMISAVDMDIKRIARVLEAGKRIGVSMTYLVAMAEQLPALGDLFMDTGMVDLYELKLEALLKDFSYTPFEPSTESYHTQKGGLLDASDIPIRRKAGRPPKQTT